MKARVPLLAALLLAGCSTAAPPAAPPSPAPAPAPAPAHAPDAGGAAGTPAPGPEMPAPAALADGDRWFVAVKASLGPEPSAVRSRRRRGEGFVREEVRWGRSFAAVAAAEHGLAQVFALFLDGKGLSVGALDDGDRPVGETRVEVPAPFRVGETWTVRVDKGHEVSGRIAALEKVETPGGAVEALRVELRAGPPRPLAMTIWYDAGLRPVRNEVRSLEDGNVVEAMAALSSPAPTPEECRAAVEWAKKVLSTAGR